MAFPEYARPPGAPFFKGGQPGTRKRKTPKRQNELEQAIELANKVLDRPNADPDDDLAVLARQFLRAHERPTVEAYEAACKALWMHREQLEQIRKIVSEEGR